MKDTVTWILFLGHASKFKSNSFLQSIPYLCDGFDFELHKCQNGSRLTQNTCSVHKTVQLGKQAFAPFQHATPAMHLSTGTTLRTSKMSQLYTVSAIYFGMTNESFLVFVPRESILIRGYTGQNLRDNGWNQSLLCICGIRINYQSVCHSHRLPIFIAKTVNRKKVKAHRKQKRAWKKARRRSLQK